VSRRSLAASVVLVAACGCSSHARRASDAVVPWVNRPLPLYTAPEAKLVAYPVSAPLCRAGQLRVGAGRTGVGLGNRLEELVFTNVGPRPCLLRGHPTITAGGRTLHPQLGGTYFGRLVPADLASGGHVFLDFATGTACDNGQRMPLHDRGLVVTLPQGGRVRAPRLSITDICGLSMSDFGLPERYAEPRLRARVELPSVARAGTTLRYSVVLSNPTAAKVAMRPCRGYTESAFAAGVVVRRSFALDCDSVHAVPAHGSVRYAMELKLPGRSPAGLAKLGWSLDTPVGPYAGGVFRITRRRP
jgi:Protein of unknown function (DUF4232)